MSSGRASPDHYGHLDTHIIQWDCSCEPVDNSKRSVKLGHYWQTHNAAIVEQDDKKKFAKFADGILVKDHTRSNFPPEPDSHVLRLHVKDGRGRDGVWTHRNIVEHSWESWKREHRSTLWIDQNKIQMQAWSHDAFWIVNLGAAFEDRELEFTGAGFLSMVCEKSGAPTPGGRTPTATPGAPPPGPPTASGNVGGGSTGGGGSGTGPGGAGDQSGGPGSGPSGPRSSTDGEAPQRTGSGKKALGALAFNIGKRAGIVTDGGSIAALWHVLHITPGASLVTPEKATSENIKDCKVDGGTASVAASGRTAPKVRPEEQQELGLRGDVNFVFGTTLAHIAIVPPPARPKDEGDCILKGHIYIDEPAPFPPAREMNKDTISPQPVLKRKIDRGLHVWMRFPCSSISSFVTNYVSSFFTSYIRSTFSVFSKSCDSRISSLLSSMYGSSGAGTGEDAPKYQYECEDGGSSTGSFASGGSGSGFNPGARSNWTPTLRSDRGTPYATVEDASNEQPETPGTESLSPAEMG